MYVFDLEADGLLDSVTTVHCGVFECVKTGDVKKFRPHQIQDMLKFMDTQSILIGHNVLSYDFLVLEKLYGYKFKGKKIDTVIMSRLLYPNRMLPKQLVDDYRAKRAELPDGMKLRTPGPHSVASWGYTLGLGKVDYDDWDTFDEEMMHRCATDVRIQVLIFKRLRAKLKELDWPTESLEVTFKCFDILARMEQQGWLVDKNKIYRSIYLLSHWISRIDRIVIPLLPNRVEVLETKKDGAVNWVRKPFLASGKYSAITVRTFPELEGKTASTGFVSGPFSRVNFRKVNLDSRNEAVDFLLSIGWQPKEYNYQTDDNGRVVKDQKGNPIPVSPKLNYKDPFVGVTGLVGQLIVKRVQCRQRRSTLEGWLALIRPDGTISQRITGIATTGRLTHSGIVNVPGARSFFGKRMRSCFIAREGYKIVGTDSVSCQDRMLAARANDQAFTEMLLNGDKDKGTDGHSMNMHAINRKFKENNLQYTVSRDISKNLGYGWKFGASDNKLAVTANVPNQYGALIREALSEVSTAQAALVEDLLKQWRKTAQVKLGSFGKPAFYNGYIKGLDGRPIFIEHEHTILVFMLQSDEAIMMQLALVLLNDRLQQLGWEWGKDYCFVANVHDEFQCEVRTELAGQYAKIAARAIVKASEMLKCNVLAAGDSSIGNNWYETH